MEVGKVLFLACCGLLQSLSYGFFLEGFIIHLRFYGGNGSVFDESDSLLFEALEARLVE